MAGPTLKIEDQIDDERARDFCDEFINSIERPKYLFGRNIYADKITKLIDIKGFIDDYSDEAEFLGKPIVRLEQVPKSALVLILSGGKPLSAEKRVKGQGLECLDYFAFYRYSGLPLEPVRFMAGFAKDLKENRSKYEWIYGILRDEVSKEQFYKLVNFKLHYDLNYLRGFKCLEHKQYFEPFLGLKEEGEVFADVGGYDGYTSQEFIRLYPKYRSVHLFEPEAKNISVARDKLKKYKNINFYQLGLSNEKETLHFDVQSSNSKICEDGNTLIEADKLDDVIHERITFMKVDVEGAESRVIDGAKETIRKCRPKLAVCAYHQVCDFWKIPEQIFSIRADYDLYLRHYTESIYETVMFFL